MDIAKSRNFLLKESIEQPLDEMAKIQGELKDSIEAVIAANPDLNGLPLKKAIRADQKVLDALDGDDLYDNQLNKFIASAKGEREVGSRGRKPGGSMDAKNDIVNDLGTPAPEPEMTSSIEGEDNEDIDDIIDTWAAPEEEEDVIGTPTIDKSIEKELPSDVGSANAYKNIILKKVQKIEALSPQERANSIDMAALKSYIKKPEVFKALGRETIQNLVSPIIG